MATLVCLTLLVPTPAQQRLIDFLLAQDAARMEFSMHAVAARGPLVRMQPGEEQVLGFAARTEVKLILPPLACEALLPPLRALLAGCDGGFWVTPVQRFEAFNRTPVAEGVV
jgi:hypothetical protein